MAIECPKCGQSCKNGSGLSAHWRHNHDGEPPEECLGSNAFETRIPCSVEARELLQSKQKPGESYNDTLLRVLDD